jgi:hypothetical protein
MNARDDLFELGTSYPHTLPAESVNQLLDAYRAEVLREGAAAINELPQDWECDPGRGDAAELLRVMAGATEEKSSPAGAEATPEPYTDSETAFMQIGTARWPRRAVLHLEGLPPLVGTYNGAGMRRLDHHAGLIVEPMLAFADRPEITGKDVRP